MMHEEERETAALIDAAFVILVGRASLTKKGNGKVERSLTASKRVTVTHELM